MRSETPIHFYKQDHDHDPVRVGRYILFGVQDCMRLLRPVVKIGNLIVAIGGRTAKDGLADRLTWAGIVIGRRPDGVVICLGFLLGPYGPRTWRARFPLIAAFIDPVTQGHRNQSITPELQREFRRLFTWGKRYAARHRGDPSPHAQAGGGCPPPRARRQGPCPKPVCPPGSRGRRSLPLVLQDL